MSEQKTAGTSRGAAIFGMLITFFGGYFLGVFTSSDDPRASLSSEAREVERVMVPIGTSPTLGQPTAPVTVVEYADFLCGHCAHAVRLQKQVRAEFQDKVRWVFKPFPLNSKPDSPGLLAAKAALAAGAQGKFWEFHDRLFAEQKPRSREELEGIARDLGLDQARFLAMMNDPALERSILAGQEQAHSYGVQGTPTFFVNGRKIVGAVPFPSMEQIVHQELALAGELLRQGVARDQLYEAITAKGKQKTPASPKAGAAPETRQPTGAEPAQQPAG